MSEVPAAHRLYQYTAQGGWQNLPGSLFMLGFAGLATLPAFSVQYESASQYNLLDCF